MGFKVELTKVAVKSAGKLSEGIKKDIKSKIIWLSENSELIVHKKLKGQFYSDIFKLRIGSYRILYSLDKQNKRIIIEFIGHRKNIYK